jgi:ABC-type transport system involved in multi-copper enzyme maturation permease subunit
MVNLQSLKTTRAYLFLTTPHYWRKAVPVLLLLICAVGLIWYSERLPWTAQLVSWAILSLVLAYLSRPFWNWFFSPVLVFDIIRTTRRSRFAVMRAVYAFALLASLFVVYLSRMLPAPGGFWQLLWQSRGVPLREAADFAGTFFMVFASIQILAVLILTPICAAPALAEEKERRTFEFLLATRLTSSEIIVGKLFSRLSYLVLIVLTGLPILGLMQFLGGIDPRLLLAVFGITAATVFSVTCLSVACSVVAQSSRGAILLTYTYLACFVAVSGCCTAIPLPFLSLGNPVGAFVRLFYVIPNAGMDLYGELAGEYTFLHLFGGALLYRYAVVNLRLGTTKADWGRRNEAAPAPVEIYPRRPRAHWDMAVYHRPTIRDRPILWKELYAEPIVELGGAGGLAAIIGTGMILPITYSLLMAVTLATAPAGIVSRATNPLAAYGGSFIGCVLLVGVALKAGGAINRERMRRTWDNILTTTLDNRTILLEKLFGSILSVRNGWWVLGCVWGLGVVTGGLHPLGLLLLIVVWFVLAALVATIGLFCSLGARTPLQASLGSLVSAVAITLLPWILWGIIAAIVHPFYLQQYLAWLGDLVWYGLTPPITLGTLAFPLTWSYSGPQPEIVWWRVSFAMAGTACYALLAFVFWKLLLARFGLATGRMPFPNHLESKQRSTELPEPVP